MSKDSIVILVGGMWTGDQPIDPRLRIEHRRVDNLSLYAYTIVEDARNNDNNRQVRVILAIFDEPDTIVFIECTQWVNANHLKLIDGTNEFKTPLTVGLPRVGQHLELHVTGELEPISDFRQTIELESVVWVESTLKDFTDWNRYLRINAETSADIQNQLTAIKLDNMLNLIGIV